MIRIQRGPEPPQLPAIRAEELSRVRRVLQKRPLQSDDFGRRYTEVKHDLAQAQHRKCCYCEFRLQIDYNDLEHIRPKTRANRGPEFHTNGYWWLAWTWKNLLFACPSCNRIGKNAAFPLMPGSAVLEPMEDPPGAELPFLIDPTLEDPIDFIQFKPFKVNSKERWKPFPRNNHPRGKESIVCFMLDRPTLIDEYSRHVHEEINPKIHSLRRAMDVGSPEVVRSEWKRITRKLLRPAKWFSALAYDALDLRIPAPLRETWGLELPRP